MFYVFTEIHSKQSQLETQATNVCHITMDVNLRSIYFRSALPTQTIKKKPKCSSQSKVRAAGTILTFKNQKCLWDVLFDTLCEDNQQAFASATWRDSVVMTRSMHNLRSVRRV